MPRRHRGERRRRITAAAAIALATAACSSTSHPAAPATSTAPTSVASTSTSAPAIPPQTSARLVTGAHGPTFVVTITGHDNATVALPANVGLPAIVHAEYHGTASFVVSTLDARGRHLAIAASSLGAYDGTFPVGFVDRAGDPSAGLRVATLGSWQLDVSNPVLAPALRGHGVSGHGDAVLSYAGRAVSAHVTYPDPSSITISTFGKGSSGKGTVTMLVSKVGPYDGRIALPAGPALISVTAAGEWSMSLG